MQRNKRHRAASKEGAPARAALAAIGCYVARFLSAEHPDLGRPGPVCPFTRMAIDQDLILLTAGSLTDEAAIVESVGRLRSARSRRR